MIITRFVVSGATLAVLSTRAFAQQPASRVMTLEVAEIIAKEAMATCRAAGYRATVLVVDALNAPKVMLRDDGATASTTEVARMKATSAMLYDRASGSTTPLPPGTPASPAPIPGTLIASGGVPIKAGGLIIGAIGISATPGGAGASGADTVCANAGIAKAADRLK